MPKPANQASARDAGSEPLKPKAARSALSDFVEKNVPSEDEAQKFDQYVHEEVREHEIEEGLAEIYRAGGKEDFMSQITKTVRHGWPYKILKFWIIASALLGLAWLGYYFLSVRAGANQNAVILAISADQEVLAGKEFYYTVVYKNLSQQELKKLSVDLVYPDNFVFIDASPMPTKDKNSWQFDALGVRRSGEIKIKGKLIGEQGAQEIVLGRLTYQPANFSSDFKKEASFQNTVSGTGLEINVDYPSSALVGETNEIVVKYRAQEENYLNNFTVSMDLPENLELAKDTASGTIPGSWTIGGIAKEEQELKIRFKFKDKTADSQEINMKFQAGEEASGGLKTFLNKKLTFEVMKRDLNLTLIVNGARTDQGVNFGQTLNYSIVYKNMGKTTMKDVVVQAVLDSDFLDWASLKDANKGKVSAKSISWSKVEIPVLSELAPGSEGTIDFSINLMPAGQIDPGKSYQVKSYAQFSIGVLPEGAAATSTEAVSKEAGQSNVIISKINSDLSLAEEVRYFNDDNIAVGSGPLPPKVGETTSYKIYWVLTNNLNELSEVTISAPLAAGVAFDQKSRASVGSIEYDQTAKKIIWRLGRMPITVYKAEAEFNIAIKPTTDDANKIMVMLSGTEIAATDSVTNSPINKKLKPKTTKLESDPVAEGDGRVVQ